MVFSCRHLIFRRFYCEQPLEKGCFSRISDGTLGTFLAWCCFPAGSCFFDAVFLRAAAGNRILRKGCFLRLGTSSSFRAMVFSCRELLFSTLFSCEQPQATESCEKGCFSTTWCFPAGSCFFRRCFPASSRRQQRKRLFFVQATFFCVVLDLARPSEPQLFFFDAVLLRAATGNRISRKRLFF